MSFPIGNASGVGAAGTRFLSSSAYLPAKTGNQSYAGIPISEGGDYSVGGIPVFMAPEEIVTSIGQIATSSYSPTSVTGSMFFLGKTPSGGGQNLFDANTPGYPQNPATLAQGQALSDEYTIFSTFTFYTTGLPFRSTSNPVKLSPNGNGNTLGHFPNVFNERR